MTTFYHLPFYLRIEFATQYEVNHAFVKASYKPF